eukprot:2480280-Lingulodinium_polyedra.AAC.1
MHQRVFLRLGSRSGAHRCYERVGTLAAMHFEPLCLNMHKLGLQHAGAVHCALHSSTLHNQA